MNGLRVFEFKIEAYYIFSLTVNKYGGEAR